MKKKNNNKMTRANYDTPWKLMLERYFKELIEFLLPEVAREIDWELPHEFLDSELLAIQKESDIGRMIADKLVKVFTKQGQEAWVIVHIEVQGTKEEIFPQRLFEYYYKIYDRYKKPLMTLAILTDASQNWRPNEYQRQLWGCRLLLEFPSIKLLDFENQLATLDNSLNPFAQVVKAHIESLKTRGKLELRKEQKINLVKKLYLIGLSKDDISNLFVFIDYVLHLPKELEKEFKLQIIKFENEVNMRYMTSIERIGREEGIQIGECKIVRMLLEQKFGALTPENTKKLESMDPHTLEKISKSILKATRIDDIFSEKLPVS